MTFENVMHTLGNSSYKKVCGFCTFVHILWKVIKLHRGFTSDVRSHVLYDDDDDGGINEDSDNARLYLFDSDNNGNVDNE